MTKVTVNSLPNSLCSPLPPGLVVGISVGLESHSPSPATQLRPHCLQVAFQELIWIALTNGSLSDPKAGLRALLSASYSYYWDYLFDCLANPM